MLFWYKYMITELADDIPISEFRPEVEFVY